MAEHYFYGQGESAAAGVQLADQCLVVQADVLAKAGAARMSVDGPPPPNRLRGWSAASPEDLIEVRG